MLHLLDHLRNLLAQVDTRAQARGAHTTVCDICASICTDACRYDAQRFRQEEVRLYAGIARR